MSPNPYPFFSVLETDKPVKIKVKIKMLTLLYLKDPDTAIAQAIILHIARLLTFPGYISNAEQRCQLRRLEMHWRCMTWNSNTNRKNK